MTQSTASTRVQIDEARRRWAVYAEIRTALARAQTDAVIDALRPAASRAYDAVDFGYRSGRSQADLRATLNVDNTPPSEPLALAGWCDEMLARLRGD